MNRCYPVSGTGLGLRRTLMGPLMESPSGHINFFEVAPENWIGVGGRLGRQLHEFTEQYPFVCHGLSLSLGGPSPLDEAFLYRIKRFLDLHDVRCYSEHLSYCSDAGQLYDLLPIPFTAEAVAYVAERIRRTQDILDRRIAIENVSYYAGQSREMTEIEFLNAVLESADCDLLLDVNNIYVNSINHDYAANEFLAEIPGNRIAYMHVAGHYEEAQDLRIDTHGSAVIEPVWDLLEQAYAAFGVIPTLLERDFNIPPLNDLVDEVAKISTLQKKWSAANDLVPIKNA